MSQIICLIVHLNSSNQESNNFSSGRKLDNFCFGNSQFLLFKVKLKIDMSDTDSKNLILQNRILKRSLF